MTIDLTPFGFTPTETAVYDALLRRGPSSGYAVAKEAGLARANAYAALDGLVAKGAAAVDDGSPKTYRPVAPTGVLASISARQQTMLGRLEEQVASHGGTGDTVTVAFRGDREFRELALRTAVREPRDVTFVGTGTQLAGLLPVWRKREAHGQPTTLVAIGDPPHPFPIVIAGAVPEPEIRRAFGGDVAVRLASEAAVLGLDTGAGLDGVWTTDALLTGLARAAVQALLRDVGST